MSPSIQDQVDARMEQIVNAKPIPKHEQDDQPDIDYPRRNPADIYGEDDQ